MQTLIFCNGFYVSTQYSDLYGSEASLEAMILSVCFPTTWGGKACSVCFCVRFDQMFESVLEQLQPVCVAEQKFLTSFFHFQKPSLEEQHSTDQTIVPLSLLPPSSSLPPSLPPSSTSLSLTHFSLPCLLNRKMT